MKDFIAILKLPPSILSALALASGFIILAPQNILEKLYFVNFKDSYGFQIGIVFVVSISILIVYSLMKIIKFFYDKYNNKRISENQYRFLKELDDNEKSLIREILSKPDYTLKLPINNGLVRKLESMYVILPAGSTHLVNGYDMRIPYFLQPWVIEMIKKNPDIGI